MPKSPPALFYWETYLFAKFFRGQADAQAEPLFWGVVTRLRQNLTHAP